MDVKKYAYDLAINKFESELVKTEKQIDQQSTKMHSMLDGSMTMRARANARARLDTLCESAQRYRGYIEELQKLKEAE